MLTFDLGNIASIVVQKKFKTEFGVIHETDAEYASKKHLLKSLLYHPD